MFPVLAVLLVNDTKQKKDAHITSLVENVKGKLPFLEIIKWNSGMEVAQLRHI